ncbi:hypothetical protein [Catalinimonas niigatensis]|uniref:hypothetical protein n=1 Tax=Catalinimonas niigatensis TaxID=1397264 RepID=UPI00266704FE|nr:hypothetical protein [Catalinimonas niigatensis]WPP51193.1 hypothetical protein PZB72_02160 [Catalinimonas niigatensis]
MNESEKKLYNHLYYRRKKEQMTKEKDAGNISKAILNLEAIYNEVSNRHLQSPSEYSRMILENLERPIRVLRQYKELKEVFERRIEYILGLVRSAIHFTEMEHKQLEEEDDL